MFAEVYLDNNATTHLSTEVRDAMCTAIKRNFGNPSSEHSSGESARRAIAKARDFVAELVRAPTESVVFGSGVTELNNWVVLNALNHRVVNHYIVSSVEHSSVLEAALVAESRGIRVTRIPVSREGLVDVKAVRAALDSSACLVSIQWVNNETGTIQPVEAISQVCLDAGVPYHCDAAQAVGKLEVDLSKCKIDYLTASAHKMHGPAGIGALVIRNRRKLVPLFYGGSQEFGMRPGTENIIGIIGFGCAAETRARKLPQYVECMRSLRDEFESKIKIAIPSVQINGCTSQRVCNTTNILFPNLDGAALVALLDRQGVRCSQTSACTSSRPEPSHVLTAMGLTERDAYSSVRFSFSDQNTMADVVVAVSKIVSVVERLQGHKFERCRYRAEGMIANEV